MLNIAPDATVDGVLPANADPRRDQPILQSLRALRDEVTDTLDALDRLAVIARTTTR